MSTKEYPCPCCQFLPDNLFLPTQESPQEKHRRNPDTNTACVLEPRDAWTLLQNRVLVDTHGHAHLERESSSLYQPARCIDNDDNDNSTAAGVVRLSCAVEQSDWGACLQYAAQATQRMAALGIHPWYLQDLTDNWFVELESLLQKHPGCMVGEIGLCKRARFVRTYSAGKQAALLLQRDVFAKQLEIATRLQRPVSIHCVSQQGVMLDVFKEQSELPPAMALHSFSGTAHQIQELLKWEDTLNLSKPLLYFGFSHSVNYAMSSSDKSRRHGREAIRRVPHDRLLAESDVHCTDNVAVGTSGSIAYIAWALEEPIETVAEWTSDNGLRFLKQISLK